MKRNKKNKHPFEVGDTIRLGGREMVIVQINKRNTRIYLKHNKRYQKIPNLYFKLQYERMTPLEKMRLIGRRVDKKKRGYNGG